MAVTVALAVAGGIVTGSIMKLVVGLSPPPSNNPKSKQDIEEMELEDAKALPKEFLFDDVAYFYADGEQDKVV